MRRPLEDVRVLAIEQFGAGPWATLQLADLGAEVIKVEDPRSGGDVGRYVPPYRAGEDSLYFETFNRGKRSVSLDLRSRRRPRRLRGPRAASDAVYSNLRGDQPAKLRITYDDLREVNPRIVCCSLSGFGNTGPRRAEPAYDYVLQAMAGWMSVTGEPGGPPTKSGLSLVDFCGGYVSALALVGGVWRARRDGVGRTTHAVAPRATRRRQARAPTRSRRQKSTSGRPELGRQPTEGLARSAPSTPAIACST